jgi:hypothetical protein
MLEAIFYPQKKFRNYVQNILSLNLLCLSKDMFAAHFKWFLLLDRRPAPVETC